VVFFRLPACGGRNRRGDSAAHTVGGLATAKNHFAVTDNDILDEAMDNLREAGQSIRAAQNLMSPQGMTDNDYYRELIISLRAALVMTDAAYMEARRRTEM
jgi:hypothetical protein